METQKGTCIYNPMGSLNYCTHAASRNGSRICLVGVNMHRKGVFRADADDGVTENKASFCCVYCDLYYLCVLYSEFLGILGGHVDMSLSNYNALFKLDLACRTYELTCSAALDIARLTDGSGNADRPCVGSRKLYLIGAAAGSEYGNACKLLFGAYDGNALI